VQASASEAGFGGRLATARLLPRRPRARVDVAQLGQIDRLVVCLDLEEVDCITRTDAELPDRGVVIDELGVVKEEALINRRHPEVPRDLPFAVSRHVPTPCGPTRAHRNFDLPDRIQPLDDETTARLLHASPAGLPRRASRAAAAQWPVAAAILGEIDVDACASK
jgi:hypothetical protein